MDSLRRLQLLAGCAILAVAGCRGSGRDSGGGLFGSRDTEALPVARTGDPLFGDRIPKQNVPTRGSDAIGAKGRDPLFGLPEANDRNPTERAGKPENKGSASLGGRSDRDEPFRPGRDTTNAALAITPDDSTLSIGPRRGPASGSPASTRGLATYEQMVQELRRLGARISEPALEKGGYLVRAEVPIDPDLPGPARYYEGFGNTPAVALRQILEQVRSDRLR